MTFWFKQSEKVLRSAYVIESTQNTTTISRGTRRRVRRNFCYYSIRVQSSTQVRSTYRMPNASTQKHYFFNKSLRYALTLSSVAVASPWFIPFSIDWVVLIIAGCLAVIAIPLMIFMILFSWKRIEVTEEGIKHGLLFTTQTKWKDIQKINCVGEYQIVTKDNTEISLGFQPGNLEKFEHFLESLRLHNIPIETKEITIPHPNPMVPGIGDIPKKLYPVSPQNLVYFGIAVCGIPVGVCPIAVFGAVAHFWGALAFPLFYVPTSVLLTERLVNSYIKIHPTGIEIQHEDIWKFRKRDLVQWSDIPYAKIFPSHWVSTKPSEGTRCFIRIFSRIKDDYVLRVDMGSQAWQPMLNALETNQIPIVPESNGLN